LDPNKIKNAECEEYLKLFQLDERQYMIGIYQKGFTFYNQQVRALNIFYCLHKLGRINKTTRIGIIGGGIAGFTFAMAALNSKIKVSIIEKGDDLMPLQINSELRPIHPHIYDWPKPGSEAMEAGLPITNWRAGDANEVRTQILAERGTVEKLYSERKIPFKPYFHTYLGIQKISKIKFNKKNNYYTLHTHKDGDDPKYTEINCDILIYAIGFGIEKTYHKYDLSYWQCSAIKQVSANVFNNDRYVISGVGDGGLMELLLGRLKEFSYKKLLNILNADNHDAQTLKSLLNDIREDFLIELDKCQKSGSKVNDAWMHEKYKQIAPRYYKPLLEQLVVKESNWLILHSRPKYEHIFNIDKVSLLNGFLIFILSEQITIIHGECKRSRDGSFKIDNFPGNSKQYAIYSRHGTEKQKLINSIPGLNALITTSNIQSKQNNTAYRGDITPLWTNDELRNIFKNAFYDDIEGISGNALQTFETFGWLLSEALKSYGKEFRLTVHTVNEENKLPYYRQIIPYFGTKESQLHGGYGRTFKWNHGSVGYSIATNNPLLIIRKNDENKYQEILPFLNLESRLKDYQNSPKMSILSIPIISNVENMATNKRRKVSNFILYLDSNDPSFFDDRKTFLILSAFLEGLVKSLRSLHEKGQIKCESHVDLFEAMEVIDHLVFSKVSKEELYSDSLTEYCDLKEKIHHKDLILENFYCLT
jgi:hypothetical protein